MSRCCSLDHAVRPFRTQRIVAALTALDETVAFDQALAVELRFPTSVSAMGRKMRANCPSLAESCSYRPVPAAQR